MKFSSFKEFRQITETVTEVINFLRTDLTKSFRELSNGLTKLNFSDNFESFTTTVVLLAGQELPVRHELKVIPGSWIKLRGNDGSISVVDGDKDWNLNYIYLKNIGATEARLTIVVLK